jgi:hypothetical protein
MRNLGITRVFDLRSDTEIEKYNSPLPDIEGIEILRTPIFQKEDYSPEMMAKYVRVVPLNGYRRGGPLTRNHLSDVFNYMQVAELMYSPVL